MSYPRKEYTGDQPKKKWTSAEARVKLATYCAYQERCQQEVRNKLAERGIFGDEAEELIVHMIEENFLNEERFAQAYVRGKFRIKKWGRNRILNELKFRKISEYCIKSGFKEIDAEEYWEEILRQVEKKYLLNVALDSYKRKTKTYTYMIGRGFESELVQEALEEVISKENL